MTLGIDTCMSVISGEIASMKLKEKQEDHGRFIQRDAACG